MRWCAVRFETSIVVWGGNIANALLPSHCLRVILIFGIVRYSSHLMHLIKFSSSFIPHFDEYTNTLMVGPLQQIQLNLFEMWWFFYTAWIRLIYTCYIIITIIICIDFVVYLYKRCARSFSFCTKIHCTRNKWAHVRPARNRNHGNEIKIVKKKLFFLLYIRICFWLCVYLMHCIFI